MKMERFYQQIRDNLIQRPAPAFEEAAWQDLERRWPRVESGSHSAFSWRWLAIGLLLLLSMGLNFLLLMQKNRQGESIPQQGVQLDTIYRHRTIVQIDTIYQSKVVYQWLAYKGPSPTPEQLPPGPGYSFRQNSVWPAKHRMPTSGHAVETAGKLPSDHYSLPALKVPALLAETRITPAFEASDTSIAPLRLLPVASPNRPMRQLFELLRPKRYQLRLGGGWSKPFHKDHNRTNGVVLGLEGALSMSDQLQLWASVSYNRLQYETNSMDDALGVPWMEPPSDDLQFSKAEMLQPSFQYAGGLQWTFSSRSAWRPLLGVGLAGVSIMAHEINYEFVNKDLDIEWLTQIDAPESKFRSNYLLLRAGVSHGLSKDLSWQLTADFRRSWRNLGVKRRDLLTLQTGFSYQF